MTLDCESCHHTALLRGAPIFSAKETEGISTIKSTSDAAGAQSWFIYIPHKFCEQEVSFAARGVQDESAERQRAEIAAYRQEGYSILDLHSAMHAQKMPHVDQYYRTDHHWKTRTALWAAREIAERTPLQYTTVTRAIRVLAELGLCRIAKDGQRFKRIWFEASGASLYNMAEPFLLSPIKAVHYCDVLPEGHNMLLAGASALSRHTMLNDDDAITYAVDSQAFGALKSDFSFLNPIEGRYRVEVWSYSPIPSENETVDKLSLALSMGDTDDPRIEKEKKSMMMDLW